MMKSFNIDMIYMKTYISGAQEFLIDRQNREEK